MSTPPQTRPRFVPEEPFPPYTYVPGRSPHPVSDPAGHQFGRAPAAVGAVDPARWRESRAYLRGVDLFNHGYYWEAHEAWEALWHAAGRRGTTADFLKGLIKLAAAGVKLRQGRAEGVRSHARRAAGLFRRAAGALRGEAAAYLGLRIGELLRLAEAAERMAGTVTTRDEDAGVRVVFAFLLHPAAEGET